MAHDMVLQFVFDCKFLWTVGASKWPFSSVRVRMFLIREISKLIKLIIALKQLNYLQRSFVFKEFSTKFADI